MTKKLVLFIVIQIDFFLKKKREKKIASCNQVEYYIIIYITDKENCRILSLQI